MAIAAAIVAGCGFVLFRPDEMSVPVAVMVVLSGLLALWPTYQAWRQPPETRPSVPLLPLTGIFYLVFFVLPATYFFSHGIPLVNTEQAPHRMYHFGLPFGTVAALFVGLAGLVLGVLAVRRFAATRIPILRLPGSTSPLALYGLAVVLMASHLAYLEFDQLTAIPSIGQFLAPAGFAGMGLVYILGRKGLVDRRVAAITLLVVVTAVLAKYFSGGFLTPIIMFSVYFAVLELWCKGQLGLPVWVGGAVIVIGLFALYPLTSQFRSVIWGIDKRMSDTEKVLLIADMVTETYFGAGDDYVYQGRRLFGKNDIVTVGRAYLLHRFSRLSSFTYVVRVTPSEIPFWEGATYRNIPFGMIPRVIWPDKPEERWGNAFGQRYALVGKTDAGTSINLPWLTEQYANFGWWGITVGMFFIGLFLGVLERVFAAPDVSETEFVIGATVLVPLFYQESNFTLMTNSVVPLAISLWLFFRIGGALIARVRHGAGV